MSKGIYTKDELYNRIDDEIGWRKKELKLFKDKIPTEKSELQVAMLRSSIPIIYAHWEGFVKTACEYYWEYVFSFLPYVHPFRGSHHPDNRQQCHWRGAVRGILLHPLPVCGTFQRQTDIAVGARATSP